MEKNFKYNKAAIFIANKNLKALLVKIAKLTDEEFDIVANSPDLLAILKEHKLDYAFNKARPTISEEELEQSYNDHSMRLFETKEGPKDILDKKTRETYDAFLKGLNDALHFRQSNKFDFLKPDIEFEKYKAEQEIADVRIDVARRANEERKLQPQRKELFDQMTAEDVERGKKLKQKLQQEGKTYEQAISDIRGEGKQLSEKDIQKVLKGLQEGEVDMGASLPFDAPTGVQSKPKKEIFTYPAASQSITFMEKNSEYKKAVELLKKAVDREFSDDEIFSPMTSEFADENQRAREDLAEQNKFEKSDLSPEEQKALRQSRIEELDRQAKELSAGSPFDESFED